MHVAAAIGTPTIGIFGPTSPWHWAPLNPLAAVIETQTDVPCRPCHKPVCRLVHHRCMRDIPAAQVLTAVHRALGQRLPRRLTPCAAARPPGYQDSGSPSREPVMADPREDAVLDLISAARSEAIEQRRGRSRIRRRGPRHRRPHRARRCASGGKVLLAGNGGSAADAQHIAAELRRPLHRRPRAACRDRADHRHLGADRDRQRLRLRAGVRAPGARARPQGRRVHRRSRPRAARRTCSRR